MTRSPTVPGSSYRAAPRSRRCRGIGDTAVTARTARASPTPFRNHRTGGASPRRTRHGAGARPAGHGVRPDGRPTGTASASAKATHGAGGGPLRLRAGPPATAAAPEHAAELAEQVGEVDALVGEPTRSRPAATPCACRAERVVLLALLGIRQRVVRALDLLEPLLGGSIALIRIRMALAGELAIRRRDTAGGGGSARPRREPREVRQVTESTFSTRTFW